MLSYVSIVNNVQCIVRLFLYDNFPGLCCFAQVSGVSSRNRLAGRHIPPGDALVLTQFWVLWHELPGGVTKPPGDVRGLSRVCCVYMNLINCWVSSWFPIFLWLYNAMIVLFLGCLRSYWDVYREDLYWGQEVIVNPEVKGD